MAEDICEVKPKLQVKHDWYQTETTVIITVLVKNIEEEFLKIEFSDSQVKLSVTSPKYEDFYLCFNLSHKVVINDCSYKLTPSKIEIKLKKLEGYRWDKLESDHKNEGSTVIGLDIQQPVGPPAYPTSKRGKDWSAVEKEIKEQEAQEKPEGDEAINKLFQEIYGKGSDEVKKAMNKSYMESGGTVLSTNWGEISKQKVDVKPPDGMEFKKWNE